MSRSHDAIDHADELDDFIVGRRRAALPPPRWKGPPPKVVDPLKIIPYLYVGRDAEDRLLRPYQRKGPNEISPGVLSTDHRKIAATLELRDIIAKEDPPQLTPEGFATERGVVGGLEGLESISGVPMEPANTPTIHVNPVLEEKGLSVDWVSAQHRLIYRALHRAMFSKHKRGTSYRIPRDSSMSNPFFQFGQFPKQHTAHQMLAGVEEILEGVAKEDWVGLANRPERVLFIQHLVSRDQAESAQKVRKVNVILNENDHPSKWVWKEVPADKHGPVARFGVTTKQVGGMRRRTAYGPPFQTNILLACFFAGIRAAYYDAHGYTFHHTTTGDKYRKLKDFNWTHVVAVDVTQMDQHYPPFLLDAFADWFEDYADPRFALMMKRMIHAPYYRPPVKHGGGGILVGNPFQLTWDIDVGLPSGVAFNPEAGKWGVTGAILCVLHDHFGCFSGSEAEVAVELETFLSGRHPLFAVQDSADDALVAMRDPELHTRLLTLLRTEKASPYFQLNVEKSAKFLGDLLRVDASSRLLMPVPDMRSFFNNRLSAEHGIRHAFRVHWAWGALAALDHYRQAGDLFNDWYKLFGEVWKRHFGDVPHLFQAAIRAAAILPKPGWDVADPITLSVLMEPSRLMHRHLPEEIDQNLLALLTAEVPGSLIDEHLGPYLPTPY